VGQSPLRQLRLAGLGFTLPVYPDGPLTTMMKVRLTDSTNAAAYVSYAACSATTCLLPVQRHFVSLA
jgi:hypothetical protein